MTAMLVVDPPRSRRMPAAPDRSDIVPLGEALGDLPQWTDLSETAVERSVFSGPAMAGAAAGTVEPADWSAVRVFSDSRLDAQVLIRQARAAPVIGPRVTDAFHSHYGPRTPPLIRAGQPGAADRLLAALAAEGKVLRLVDQNLDGAALAALAGAAGRRGGGIFVVGEHRRAFLDATASADDAVGPALEGRRLRELGRQLRKLGDVEHRTERAPGPVSAALEAFVALEQRGWKGRRGTSLADDGARLAFARRLVASLAADDRVRADTLLVGGRISAVVLTLLDGDQGFFWKIAHDPDLSAASPGAQVARLATMALLADPAITGVDSLATADHTLMDRLWAGRIRIGTVFLALDAEAVPQARRAAAAQNAASRLKAQARRIAGRLTG